MEEIWCRTLSRDRYDYKNNVRRFFFLTFIAAFGTNLLRQSLEGFFWKSYFKEEIKIVHINLSLEKEPRDAVLQNEKNALIYSDTPYIITYGPISLLDSLLHTANR
jgi:hypothetical protein